MNYYVNFSGGIASNRFHIKWIFSTQDIEKIKILVAILELQAKQHWQIGPFAKKLGKMGWIGSAI